MAGIAWETGVLAGLAAEGIDANTADLVVGTSAGSTVAAQFGSGLAPADLLARQTDPGLQNAELSPIGLSTAEVMEHWAGLMERFTDPDELRRQVGDFAIGATTVSEAERRAVVAGRLPSHEWPDRRMDIITVDAETGAVMTIDRACGIDLVDAVAASCAVPGVWPPVTINGHRYVDGGVRTLSNADFAAGYDRVLILAPMADPVLGEQVKVLECAARVEVIAPDEVSLAAFGLDPLDPDVRAPSAQAGYAQGQKVAELIASLWLEE